MTNDELIRKAASAVRSRKNGDHTSGDVGAALLTENGNVYAGVCIDTSSSMGFCAEHSAIGAMITAGESRIRRIVAVWKDSGGVPYIVAPCGRCREFIRQVDPGNLDTEVVLRSTQTVRLRELLPYFDSWERAEIAP